MASDDLEDATGADASVDQFNLNPSFGNDPSRVVRLIPTAATAINPDDTAALFSPVSITQTPRGAETKPLMPAPGQPVNLLPQGANVALPTVAPVIPAGSTAPTVQNGQPQRVAQVVTSPSAQIIPQSQGGPGDVAPVPRREVLPGAPSPGHGRGLFGSNSPDYPAFDPNADPLMTRKGILQAEMDFLQGQINRPSLKFFQAGSVEKMAAEAAQKGQEIHAIDLQMQEQKNNQLKADNSGLPRSQQTRTQNNDTIVENLLQRMRGGDQNAMDALNARGHKDLVNGYQSDMVTSMASKLDQGTKIKELLDNAPNDAAYESIRKSLNDGSHPLSHPDFDVPEKRGQWLAQRAKRDEDARKAKLMVEHYRQLIAQQSAFTDQTNPEMAKLQEASVTNSKGEAIPGLKAKVHVGWGVNGVEDVAGSSDYRKFGADKGVEGRWSRYGTPQIKDTETIMNAAFPKEERTKAIALNRTIGMATTDPKTGQPMDGKGFKELINTNPYVKASIDEGLAQASRGGGGANGQLIKLGLANQGFIQKGFDELIAAWAGGKNVVTGASAPYLSQMTQKQLRYVLDFIKKYNDEDISTRLTGAAEHVGRNGGLLAESGMEKELQSNPSIVAAHARARDEERLNGSSKVAIITDHGTRIYLDNGPAGMAVKGATRNPLPASALPGLYPELQTPVPPAPAAVAPSTGAGGPAAAPPAAVAVPPPAAAAPARDFFGLTRSPNLRGGHPAPPAAIPAPAPSAAPPAPQPAPVVPAGSGSPFTGGGAVPVPFTPAPAMTAPGQRSDAGTLSRVANAIIPAAHAEGAPPVPAGLPASWGAGVGNAPAAPAAPFVGRSPAQGEPLRAAPQPSVPTPQAPGGPGTQAAAPPPAVAAPQGARPNNTFANGVPSGGFPAHIANNPVARTVFGVAGQTAQNVTEGKPNSATISNNASIIATSAAQNESSFNPDTVHQEKDGNNGYGLFGHRLDRLTGMQRFAGTASGQRIPVNAQVSWYVREMSQMADRDPFIARTLANPNASAEDLTRVQVRMESPEGYKGPGTEEKASHWAERLASTTALLGGAGGAAAPAQPAAQPVSMPYPNPKSPQEALANYNAGVRQSPEEAEQYQRLRQARLDQATESGAHMQKNLLIGAGSVIGSAAGPVGTAAGGTLGGILGGTIEHAFTAPPEKQNAAGFTEAGAWGGAKGLASSFGGPGLPSMVGRVVANTGVDTLKKWWEGGSSEEIYDAAMKGVAESATGEAFGRGLGLGHQMWNVMSTPGKAELISVGHALSTEPPRIANSAGKMIDNPKWVTAADRAKQLHQDPDTLKYNYEQTVAKEKAGQTVAPMKEVLAERPGAVAQAKIGREQLDPIRNEVGEAPKPSAAAAPTFKHDPVNMVGNHPDVPNDPRYQLAAEKARDEMNAKAGSWKEIWNNQVNARSKLLDKAREAEDAHTYVGQQEDIKAYRAMANEVRNQQEHIATKLLGPQRGGEIMAKLDAAHAAYREAKIAGGPDIIKTIAEGGPKGRAALDAFNKLSGNDPAAKGMVDALVKLHTKLGKAAKYGRNVTPGTILGTTAALFHFIPGIGTLAGIGLGAASGLHALDRFMLERASGSTATFKKLITRQLSAKAKANYSRASSAVAGPALREGGSALGSYLQSEDASP